MQQSTTFLTSTSINFLQVLKWGKKKTIQVGAHVQPRGVKVVAGGGSQRISQQLAPFRKRLVDWPDGFFHFNKMISKLRHWFPIRYKLLSWGLIRHN